MGRIGITSINFHDGENSETFHMGSHGFSAPRGRVTVSVDFRINEVDGRFTILTETLSAKPAETYDDLVQRAYQQVAERLASLGKLADELRAEITPAKG